MQALVHGDMAVLHNICSYLPILWQEKFSLACQSFYQIVQHLSKKKFSTAYFTHHLPRHFEHVLHGKPYAKNLRNVFMRDCVQFVKPILQKYSAQLETVALQSILDAEESYFVNDMIFPQVTYLHLTYHAHESLEEQVSAWIKAMPNLKTIALEFSRPEHKTTEPIANVTKLAPLVAHVPSCKLLLNELNIACVAPFEKHLTRLEIQLNSNMYWKHLNECKQLTELKLSGYYSYVINDQDGLLALPNLSVLQMRDLKFENERAMNTLFVSIPQSVTELEVCYTSISKFPSFQHLHLLNELSLDWVEIHEKKIPEWIASFQHLEYLEITNSLDENLPLLEHFSCSLNEIKLQRCNVHFQPNTKNLNRITLYNCKVANLEEQIKACGVHPNELIIDDCQGIQFTNTFDFGIFKHLSILEIQHHTIVPNPSLKEMLCLNELILNYCDLYSVPMELGTLPSLTLLHVSSNKIANLDNLVENTSGYFSQLKKLVAIDNPLQCYPSSILLPELEALEASPLSQSRDCSPLLQPAHEDRIEWTLFALQYIRSTFALPNSDKEGCKQLHEAYISYMIPKGQEYCLGVILRYTQTYMDSFASVSSFETSGAMSMCVHQSMQKVTHCNWTLPRNPDQDATMRVQW